MPWRCSSYPNYIFHLFTTSQFYVWLKFRNSFISWNIRTKIKQQSSSIILAVPLSSSSLSLGKSTYLLFHQERRKCYIVYNLTNYHSSSSTPSLSWIFITCLQRETANTPHSAFLNALFRKTCSLAFLRLIHTQSYSIPIPFIGFLVRHALSGHAFFCVLKEPQKKL